MCIRDSLYGFAGPFSFLVRIDRILLLLLIVFLFHGFLGASHAEEDPADYHHYHHDGVYHCRSGLIQSPEFYGLLVAQRGAVCSLQIFAYGQQLCIRDRCLH